MKEIISALVIIASILGGTAALKEFHDAVRKAALEKAAQGLPSLIGVSRALQQPRKLRSNQLRIKKANDGGPHDESRHQ